MKYFGKLTDNSIKLPENWTFEPSNEIALSTVKIGLLLIKPESYNTALIKHFLAPDEDERKELNNSFWENVVWLPVVDNTIKIPEKYLISAKITDTYCIDLREHFCLIYGGLTVKSQTPVQ